MEIDLIAANQARATLVLNNIASNMSINVLGVKEWEDPT